MATKKKPIVQGGVDNYLGNQPQVQAPRRWQSGPNKPPTELAYITEAEKDLILKTDLHGSLRKGPNIGPSGIMSLDSFGDVGGGGASGGDTEAGGGAMEGRGFSGRGPSESGRDFDRRVANERAALQIAERQQAERLGYRERADISRFKSRNRGAGISGILGALGRGALSIFGGIPGKIMSGIMTAKNWAGNQGSNLWSGVKEFGARDEEGNPLYPTWESFANRNKVQAIEPIAQDPDLYTDQMKEFRMRNPLDLTNTLPNNLTNNMGVNQNVPSNQELLNFQPYKDGGRIGYRTAGPVLGDDEASENIFEFMQDQNIPFGEMVSNPHPLDALNDFSLEIFNKPYDQLNDEERGILHDLANEQAMGEQDQGIASLV